MDEKMMKGLLVKRRAYRAQTEPLLKSESGVEYAEGLRKALDEQTKEPAPAAKPA